jgi:serine/threonine-protein kinase
MRLEGDCEGARASEERAVALKVKALGEDHPDVAVSLQNLCEMLVCLGRLEDAVQAGTRAIAITNKITDSDAFIAGLGYANRGRAFIGLRRYAEAHADLTRALDIYANDSTIMKRVLAEPLHGLGEIRLAEGRAFDAIAYLERALRIREGHEPDARLVAESRFALARALHAAGRDRRRARALAMAARESYASMRRPEEREVSAWLGAHRRGGRTDRLEVAGRI